MMHYSYCGNSGVRRTAFIFMAIILLPLSCGEEASRQTVPYAPVNFRVDPDGYDPVLKNPHTYKIFTEKDRRLPTDRFGYAGLLVVTGAEGELYAYDLCCPHEDSRAVTVDPVYEGKGGYNGKVKCPSCGSVFVTMFGHGSVDSGPSAENLQIYKVSPQTDGSCRLLH